MADQGSRNGTWVNGKAVSGAPVALVSQDVIRLGDVLMVYEDVPDGAGNPAGEADLPGVSAAITAARRALATAAEDAAPLLIRGETGTGKEGAALQAHRLSGRPGPLHSVNCAALAANLVESELFGHARGAFTGATEQRSGLFQAADGGSLFLDEVGDLQLDLQPKLLRVIQTGEVIPVGSSRRQRVQVRVVAATHQDLPAMVESGRFRRDLYARLSLWEVELPPLRRRRADIPMWLSLLHQAWMQSRGSAVAPLRWRPSAMERLLMAHWPENLRGLDRLIRQLGGAADHEVEAEDLPAWVSQAAGAVAREDDTDPNALSADGAKPPAPSREQLQEALERLGSVRATARHFARDRRQIYRWIKAHGLAMPASAED